MDSLNTHDTKESIPSDYRFIPVYFVFDVQYNGRRKTRFVAAGHQTNPGTSEIYSEVVSIEHVTLFLLWTDSNNLDVIAADIRNSYLHEKQEKSCTQRLISVLII